MRLRKSWLVGAGAVVVLALGCAGVYQLASRDGKGTAAKATAQVRRGTVSAAVAAAGTLQPGQTRGLAFSMAGTVTEVRVRAGDRVTAGQVLARIDDADAKDKVSRAQDALDSAEQSLDAAEQAASAGSSSSSGCVAVAAYTSPTPSSPASPTPAASASRGGQPAASAAPAIPTTGGRPTGAGTIRPSGGGNNCANGRSGGGAGGANAGGGSDRILSAQQQVNNAKLQLENAQQDLAGTTITAPIAGKVLSVAGSVGSRATAGSSGFIVLGDVADMQVKASFPEADASGLKVGQQATVTLADRPDEPLPAKITQVDPIGTADGQMVRFGVLLAFDKVPSDVLSGQSANVRVQTQSVTNVLYVPAGALHGSTVKVIRGAATEERQVEVGLRGDQYTEIRSGLAAGEEVLTSW